MGDLFLLLKFKTLYNFQVGLAGTLQKRTRILEKYNILLIFFFSISILRCYMEINKSVPLIFV